MLGKKRKVSEVQPEPSRAPQPAPKTAGAPDVSVRKEWRVGPYTVLSVEDKVTINPTDRTLAIWNSVSFPREFAAAIADALLQAS